jgi:hypothetical protein
MSWTMARRTKATADSGIETKNGAARGATRKVGKIDAAEAVKRTARSIKRAMKTPPRPYRPARCG